MPVFQLSEDLVFPDVELATSEGILAIGGDLSPERLVLAYKRGIFPWFSDDQPIIWWAPDPRFVLFPEDLKISKSMKSVFNKGAFEVRFDTCFSEVINACKTVDRKEQDGTWITDEMKNAYIKLHELGLAHSVEVFKDDCLVGGLYGISLGKVFFGESMFANESNASKVGFITLVQHLKERGFEIIDCQVYTQHLESLGGIEVPRKEFMHYLRSALSADTLKSKWTTIFN